jgi:hypothetical protein
MCFILSDLKCYENAASRFKNHLWNVKEKDQWKNNKKINKLSNLQNIVFSFLDPSYCQTS